MNTNVIKKTHPATNSFRLAIAKDALVMALKPKEKITVMHAVLYADNARVHYLEGFRQKHAKILLPKLEAFVLDGYSSSDISDINIYYFLEEKIKDVCQAYIAAGKEIIAL